MSKGILIYAYDFNMHCYVGHLWRVHATDQPMEVEWAKALELFKDNGEGL